LEVFSVVEGIGWHPQFSATYYGIIFTKKPLLL